MTTHTETTRVPVGNFYAAMRLLGLDPDNNHKALVSVHIEAGQITAGYSQVGRIVPDAPADPDDGAAVDGAPADPAGES